MDLGLQSFTKLKWSRGIWTQCGAGSPSRLRHYLMEITTGNCKYSSQLACSQSKTETVLLSSCPSSVHPYPTLTRLSSLYLCSFTHSLTQSVNHALFHSPHSLIHSPHSLIHSPHTHWVSHWLIQLSTLTLTNPYTRWVSHPHSLTDEIESCILCDS